MWIAKGSNGRKVVIARRREELRVKAGTGQLYRRVTADVLPDDVLIEVFNFYLDGFNLDVFNGDHDAWIKLVHVCRRWRKVVFASPRRLNLQVLCTSRRPVKKLLDIWPALPIVIRDCGRGLRPRGTANLDAALKHNDSICKIAIDPVSGWLLNSMEQSFPAVTDLELWSYVNKVPVLPDSFLGGSAPRLRNLTLGGIPFPGLPKLLLSTHHLVHLCLFKIPDSGYISPEAMVTCLSLLTSIQSLVLDFQSPRSRPDQTIRPLLTRTVLPSLTSLSFKGVSEYLEDIIARIDIPQLDDIKIRFFNQLIFNTPLLHSFISRTEAFNAVHRAEILFSYKHVQVTLLQEGQAHNGVLRMGISCKPSDWQLSSLAQVCNSSLPPLTALEHLKICKDSLGWQDNMEDAQWLEPLHPFIAVKSLYLDKKLAPQVAPALQELSGERVTEVLPALQNIFVEGPVQKAIVQFINARQLLGHPVAVQDWDGKRQW